MRKLLLAFVFGLASTAVSQDALPPPFPRPNATKLLETDHIVVWSIVWPKGQPTALHRHVYDQVGTYYARGGRIIKQPDGTSRETMTEVGSLSTTRKGTTHIEEGNTDPPLRAVFIELKKDGPVLPPPPTGTTRLEVSSPAKPTFEDERVLVRDVSMSAKGFEASLRGAPGGTIAVFLAPGRVRLTDGRGGLTDVSVEPGTMRYVAPGGLERHTVVEGAPRMMMFELK